MKIVHLDSSSIYAKGLGFSVGLGFLGRLVFVIQYFASMIVHSVHIYAMMHQMIASNRMVCFV